MFIFFCGRYKILGTLVFTHDVGCRERIAREPTLGVWPVQQIHTEVVSDKRLARWATLMVHTDKGLILDGLAFNPQNNPTLNTPNADTNTLFHFLPKSLSLVSVGQLNRVTQLSD